MAQAKRNTARRKSSRRKETLFELMLVSVGVVMGAVAVILWKGAQDADGGLGTGIRNMIEHNRKTTITDRTEKKAEPSKPKTSYDFYTVLPEIEVVVPKPEPAAAKSEPAKEEKSEPVSPAQTSETSENDQSSYMLQAGSFRKQSDAERMRAELALMGFRPKIQKVTIQEKGDFFRVRLGPYSDYAEMTRADTTLNSQGIKPLRLKISKGGG